MRSSSVRWLLVVTVGVVASFVASTLFIQNKVARVDEHVVDIVGNATPRITTLAAARTAMRRFELGVGHYLGSHVQHVPFPRQRLADFRAAIDARLDTYAGSRFSEGEAPLYAELLAARKRLYAEAEQVLDDIDRDDLTAARARMVDRFDGAADALDRATERLLSFNAVHASASANAIDRIRRSTSAVAAALDGATVLMAMVLLGLAVRATRLHERILRSQSQATAERALELDHFAARVAHDLKAPLTSVLMGVSAAQLHPNDAPRLLERVRRAAGTMNGMIDALLDFARAGSAPQRGSCSLVAPVLESITAAAQPSLEESAATLAVTPVPSDCAVTCSSGALASVLSNLLQNAIKYSGSGSADRRVDVRVRMSATSVRIEVADSGPGLPTEVQDSIFEMYVRTPTSAGKPGLGLGLATVKRLVEAHGGTLGVQSAPGKGACFWVEFARAEAPELAAVAAASSPT